MGILAGVSDYCLVEIQKWTPEFQQIAWDLGSQVNSTQTNCNCCPITAVAHAGIQPAQTVHTYTNTVFRLFWHLKKNVSNMRMFRPKMSKRRLVFCIEYVRCMYRTVRAQVFFIIITIIMMKNKYTRHGCAMCARIENTTHTAQHI